ncbi:MAG: hypothetical protein RIS79_4001, partial [Verrucomicrobiota bacterium]
EYPRWQFWCLRPGLYNAIKDLQRVIFHPFTSKHLCFDFSPSGVVFCAPHVVIADENISTIGLLQSSIHAVWVWEYCSTLETRIRYAPTDNFETFAFPDDQADLENIGSRYHEHRRHLMLSRQEGLTKTYNRFHDPAEASPDIDELRSLHRQLDVAVAAAYGWDDLAVNDGARLGHGFHETKQGIRYTLAPAARREVLDRLLALNHQRHAEEVAAGLHDKKKGKAKKSATAKPATKRGRKAKAAVTETALLVMPSDFRFPAPTPQLYAVNLITSLLSARPEGLAWPILRDAFAAATTPDVMRRLALPDDKDRVNAWASRWNERAIPALLIPTLRDMTSANIAVEGKGTDAVFSLQDGPQEPATEDVGYDAWLALRVIEPLLTPALPADEAAALDSQIESILAAISP